MKNLMMILLLIGASAFAAETQPDIEFNEVDTQEIQTPLYQDEDGGDTIQVNGISIHQSNEKTWLRVAAHYETRPEWIDHLTLEFYVLMPNSGKEPVLFKGVVNYVDIPAGRDHLAEMYMHFNSYERYSSRGRSIKSAVLAKIDGQVVAVDKRNSMNNKWWETIPAHSGGLLNRLDTPFRIINFESVEAQPPIK